MRIFLFLSILVFAGCSTVDSRIKERPEVYQRLPEKQKSLVTQGEINEGMSADAVYLSWGKPDVVWRGSERGKPVEDWTYLGNRTEIVPIHYPFLISRGGHRSGYYSASDPAIISRPYPYQTVRFEAGKVVAWQKTPFGS